MDDIAFSSKRCLVRSWRSSDAERVLDIYRRWEVARWLGSDPKVMESLDHARSTVERWAALNDQEPIAGRWAVERRK
jgi:hypothetical protein